MGACALPGSASAFAGCVGAVLTSLSFAAAWVGVSNDCAGHTTAHVVHSKAHNAIPSKRFMAAPFVLAFSST
jgi:hypothetical protein